MTFSTLLRRSVFGGALLMGAIIAPSPAAACGGFFCSSAQPVNQAAERIIFADNRDGTVTAVIQIMYQGPAENFSWLLPITTVPEGDDIAVASNLAFERLQQATNPQYTLTTRTEGTCADSAPRGSFGGAAAGVGGAVGSAPPAPGGGVTVQGSGTVGAFEWTAISVDPGVMQPEQAAVDWLEANGYEASPGSRRLLAPYLKSGMYLLALRLTKGSDTGSIRPIQLTYKAPQPMIPIKLTAVAANADMGVMTWLLGAARGVPQNYYSLELNEARINWFNPGSNYADVVTAAANDASGQGFVTEFAGRPSTLARVVWTTDDETAWSGVQNIEFQSLYALFEYTRELYGTWDGFWDVARENITLPAGVSFAEFQLCSSCYFDTLRLSPTAYIAALETNVIEPVRGIQKLLDAHAYATRLYTTMSAEEMTADPLFTFNRDLPDVSNLHTAERVIECNPEVSSFEAPWRIELPQGGVIRGDGNSVGTWPAAVNEQPPNLRITRVAATGLGDVIDDNQTEIRMHLQGLYGASGSGGAPGGPGGASTPQLPKNDSGGCSASAGTRTPGAWALAALAALALVQRRRRDAAK